MAGASVAVAPVSAQSRAMGHLRVVDAPKFSALPHEILFDQALSRDARLLYAMLQAHWWQGGECYANHATLADEMGCGTRQLQRYLDELISANVVTERRRGRGQQKAYAPTPTRQGSRVQHVREVVLEEPNTTPVSAQHDTGVISNTTPVSSPYKKTPVKKTPPEEEDTGARRSDERPPTLSGQVIDLIKAGGAEVTMRPQDHKALKDARADPALVAEAYCAIFHGTWGDDFMRRSLSVQFVVGRLAGYQASKHAPTRQSNNGTGQPSRLPARNVRTYEVGRRPDV